MDAMENNSAGQVDQHSTQQPMTGAASAEQSSATAATSAAEGSSGHSANSTLYDVLVIGGGPGGSTTATLLAKKGLRVALLEKARHPRFHIGESLLPANLPLFDELGVGEEIRAIGVPKHAAEFVSPWHEQGSQTFSFAEAWNKDLPSAYQVLRSEFDEILIRNAERQGVHVVEGCKVTNVELDGLPDDGVQATALHDDGRTSQWTARFLVDASGRDTFLANRFKIKYPNPNHNSTAIYAHFQGAKRHPGAAQGNITIFWFDYGWFWFIPLRDGITSVGMVVWPHFLKTRGKRSLKQFFLDGMTLCPALAQRMAEASMVSEVTATGNYSYLSERNHGRNYVMIGDAYAFIDPVFSSGVWLAMKGGVFAAEAIATWLSQPAQRQAALQRFDERMRHGPREFSWFIYRISNPTMRDMFMSPSNKYRMKEALLSMLAGDIYDGTPIWPGVRKLKGAFYLLSLLNPKRTWEAWKTRKHDITAIEGLLPKQTEY